ncbi:MAG: hypothetical protein H7138_16255 [Myxococcales bacterium]|nr:hypothetical protein [Myxococcales bacterium]
MTDLASPSIHDVDTDDHAYRTIRPGTLKISGDAVSEIYVIRVATMAPATAAFGCSRRGEFFIDGIEWVNDKKYAKFINFNLTLGVDRLYCAQLPYSDVFAHRQHFAILATSPAEYSFTVKFTAGELHDPKIIVTLPSKTEPG